MSKNFGIETEYKLCIEGRECAPGDALNIELYEESILKEAMFDGASKDFIIIEFCEAYLEIPIENIVDIERVI